MFISTSIRRKSLEDLFLFLWRFSFLLVIPIITVALFLILLYHSRSSCLDFDEAVDLPRRSTTLFFFDLEVETKLRCHHGEVPDLKLLNSERLRPILVLGVG
jgi:hypothetical protein